MNGIYKGENLQHVDSGRKSTHGYLRLIILVKVYIVVKLSSPARMEKVKYIHMRFLICPHREYPRKANIPPVMITHRMENLLHKTADNGPENKKLRT